MTRLHSNGALGLLDSLTYYELNWRGWLAGSLALVGTKSNRLARYICLVLSFEMDHYMSLVLSHVMVSYLTLVPSLTRARLCHLGKGSGSGARFYTTGALRLRDSLVVDGALAQEG
jgi:hypothetical protein